MNSAILITIVSILFGIVGFFSSRKTAKEHAKVIDLTVKINENKDAAAQAQKDADAKVSQYEKDLNQLDPNFNKPPTDGGAA